MSVGSHHGGRYPLSTGVYLDKPGAKPITYPGEQPRLCNVSLRLGRRGRDSAGPERGQRPVCAPDRIADRRWDGADAADGIVVLGRIAATDVPVHPIRVGADHQQPLSARLQCPVPAGRTNTSPDLISNSRPLTPRASPWRPRRRRRGPRGRSSGNGGTSRYRSARRRASRSAQIAAYSGRVAGLLHALVDEHR